jgi:hypothetical protein
MLRFTILPRAIVALNAIRSTEASRPILNGVHLAPDGTMTATDGRVLLTWRAAAKYDGDVLAVVSPTMADAFGMNGLPNTASSDGYVLEITPALLKLAKLRKCDRLALEITDDVARWTATQSNGLEVGVTLTRVLEGPYPDYRQAIPREVPEVAGEMPILNAEFLGRFALAAGSSGSVTLTPTGPERCVCLTFSHNPDAFGLIMPLRGSAAREIPAWVHPVTTAAPEVAPAPDCPAAEHDDTNAECTCSQRVRVA